VPSAPLLLAAASGFGGVLGVGCEGEERRRTGEGKLSG